MKVTVERAVLLKSLGRVHRVVERRNTIPILANVLIRADKSKLGLKATDLDLEVLDAAADLTRLIDKTQFAISTEETRYYLNGIYLHTAGSGKSTMLRAVATDGHRLAQVELSLPSGAAGMPGIIVPRKTVGEVRRLIDDAEAEVAVELS